jgi:hypothetical protein
LVAGGRLSGAVPAAVALVAAVRLALLVRHRLAQALTFARRMSRKFPARLKRASLTAPSQGHSVVIMTKAQYCQFLLKHRSRGVPLYLFLGGKWMFLKAVLIGIGLLALRNDEAQVRIVGGVVIGYALGKTVAGLMAYLSTRQRWSYADDLLNWDRVKEQAAEAT